MTLIPDGTARGEGFPPTLPSDGLRVNFRIPIGKRVLKRIILPLIILILLVAGMIQQGFIADLLNNFKKASATISVVSDKSEAIGNAQVIIAERTETTDAKGFLKVDSLIAGKTIVTVKKTGYLPVSQTFTLKRGANELGKLTLQTEPVERVNLILKITDYITEEAIADASVALNDLKPIIQDGYRFNEAPLGSYKLTVSRSGFHSYASELKVEEKSSALDEVKLVRLGTVVFESNRDRGLRGIFKSNYDGSQQENLIRRIGDFEDFSPSLGPNQKKLIFYSTRDGIKQENDQARYKPFLYMVDVDGKNLTKISEQANVTGARWSPQGGYITYVYFGTDDKARLYIYDVVKQATYGPAGYTIDSWTPVISHDEKSLAFTGRKDEEGSSSRYVYYATVDSRTIRSIDDRGVNSLEFLPDGKLRYASYAGSTTKYIEYDPGTETKTEVSAPAVDKYGAVLSPDKKLRAYVSTRDGKSDLYLSDPDGKNEKQLTKLNKVGFENLLWSTDSSFLLFNYLTQGESARYLVAANGKAEPKKVADINLSYSYY